MKLLIAEWLEQVSRRHEMCCHDLEVISFNPGRGELEVRSTSVLSRTWTKIHHRHVVNSWKLPFPNDSGMFYQGGKFASVAYGFIAIGLTVFSL